MSTPTTAAATTTVRRVSYVRIAARLLVLVLVLSVVALGATARALPEPQGVGWRSQVVTAGTVLVEWGWHLQVNTEYAPEAARRLIAVDPELSSAIGQRGATWLLANGRTDQQRLQGARPLALFAPHLLLNGEPDSIAQQALMAYGDPTDPSVAPFVVEDSDTSRAARAAATLVSQGDVDRALEVLDASPPDTAEARALATEIHAQATSYDIVAATLPFLDPSERPSAEQVAEVGELDADAIRFLWGTYDGDVEALGAVRIGHRQRDDLVTVIDARFSPAAQLAARTALAGQGRPLSESEQYRLVDALETSPPGQVLDRATALRQVIGDAPATVSLAPLYANLAAYLRNDEEHSTRWDLTEEQRLDLSVDFAELALSYDPWNARAWNQLGLIRTGPESTEAHIYAALGDPGDSVLIRNLTCELIWSDDAQLQMAGEAIIVRLEEGGDEVVPC